MNKQRISTMILSLVAISAFCSCTPEELNQVLGQLGISGISISNSNANGNANTNTNTNANGNTNTNANGNDNSVNGNTSVPSPFGTPANVPDARFPAVLSGAGPEHGDVVYREVGTRRKLNVELEDAAIGSTHAIFVDGVSVGDLVIGPLGQGEIEFDTNIEPGHVPWPANLPLRLGPGVVIEVGNTSGTLAG